MSRSRRHRAEAFTLLEAAVASAMLVLLVAAMAISLTQINRLANAARLKTLALAMAQQKVDEVLTTPWKVRNTRPTVLVNGIVTENALVLNDDAFNSQSGLSSAFTALDTPVTARRITQVTDLPPRSVRAVVTVNFDYRGRTYSTSLTTLRVTDDI